MTNPLTARLLGLLEKLSFPRLFVVTAGLFLVDAVIPDVIPFVDEILLGLATLLLSRLRKPDPKPEARPDATRPPIDGEFRRQ